MNPFSFIENKNINTLGRFFPWSINLLINHYRSSQWVECILAAISMGSGCGTLQDTGIRVGDVRNICSPFYNIVRDLWHVFLNPNDSSLRSSYVSVLTIVAFSMERYLAICHPLRVYSMSGLKRPTRFILAAWSIAMVLAIPFAIYTKVNFVEYPPG